jgi:hypothetical protein
MTSRFSALPATLFLALCVVLPLPGFAAAGTHIQIVDDGPVVLSPASGQAATGVCVLEPAARGNISYILSSPDVFRKVAWRIPFASCTACPATQALQINSMAFRVRWFGACTATAEVSIVGATGPATCRVPDTTNVLCPPVTHTIVNPSGGVGVIYTLPLSPGCCVTGEAFALVRFSGFENCLSGTGAGPGLTGTTALCTNCDQFFTASTNFTSFTDWCSFPDNSIWIQLDADCCAATGVGRGPGAALDAGGLALRASPNPFSGHATLEFAMAAPGRAVLEIFDASGRRVRRLAEGEFTAQVHRVAWDSRNDAGTRVASGAYFARLTTGDRILTQRLVLEN